MRGNSITIHLAKGRVAQTGNLFQYDYGQKLVIEGVTLPEYYEVHFSNQEHGQSKTMLGDSTGVIIPDEYLLSGEPVHVWVYLHDGADDGETEYHGIIGVTKRAQPSDQPPTPVQQDVITQTIAALNAGVAEVESIAEGIPQAIDNALEEAKESGEFDGFSPVAEVTKDGDTATVSITDKTHTTTVEIHDGEKGDPGDDGFSPSASVTKSGNTASITITDKNGTTTAQITDGQDGETGATPVISIGTVSKLSPGSDPTASMDTTDPEHPVLSLGLVTGDPGEVTEEELEEATTELKSHLNNSVSNIVFPENSAFASRNTSQAIVTSFEETKIDFTKYESLVPYNGRFISSNGNDSYAFQNPYYGFTFGMYATGFAVYILSGSFPEGVKNETLDISETPSATTQNENNYYTINKPRGTIVLFTKRKIYSDVIISTLSNPFTENGLELNGVQDTFKRYSVQGSASDITPEITKLTGTLVSATNGSLSNNSSYDTYYMRVPLSSLSITCTNAYRCVITLIPPENIDGNNSLVSVVYSSSSERVETFSASYKQYVVFSCSAAQAPVINIKTDYIKSFTLPTLRLEYGQKNGFYKIVKSGSATYLYIYYASGNKIVGWELHNVPAASSNSNTWQIGHVMGYDFDGRTVSNGVELVSGGEFELAFKEHEAADYCGGNNHGDENTINFTLMIDGKTIDTANADSDFHAFDRIDAVEHAYVNRCDTPNDNILKHQKIWVFENGTVKVRQTLEFLQALNCDFLCCMLAAKRTAFTHGVRQGKTEIEDMSTSSFTKVSTSGNEMMYLMYGANATAKVTARTCDHTPAASLWINNAAALNKLYYNFYGQMPRTAVASGTVVWWEQEYDIAYN